ncbi:helix-turn-helix domain-containing protein [Candidatus Enterovibrio escicola]
MKRRFVWNNFLKYRTDAYSERGESIAHLTSIF